MRIPVRRLLASAIAAAALFGAAAPVVASAAQDDPAAPVAPFIVGGRDASEPYPWMASISHISKGARYHYCGGTLIAPDKVVTAAHCAMVFAVGVTQIRLGSYRWDSGGQVHDVAKIDVHWNYKGTFLDDVAVLTLATPSKAEPIRVAAKAPKTEAKVRAIGWGATCDFGTPNWPCNPVGLQEADLRIAADSRCVGFGFDPSVSLCVYGPKGQMACYGDSGGPLVAKVHGEWVLYGATSGDGDADAETNPQCSNGTGVWTDVTKYRDFLAASGGQMRIMPVSFTKPCPVHGAEIRCLTEGAPIRYASGVREGYAGGTKPFEPEPPMTLPYEPGALTAAFPPVRPPGHTTPIVTPLAA